ncbi:MAG: cbb3-type cytochrome c oxidase subunit 3 [Gammaproteobacteria bacterium]
MSSGTLSGIVTAILIVLFVGMWVWAFSARRRAQFDAAARLPLEEDGEARP